MKSRTTRIPVTLLTGFLGSGKSTLLNRLLRELPRRRFGLVVNEFGDASLESQLIEAKKQPLFELSAGCLCCVSDGDLQKALQGLLQRDARIDHVLVEASGLSAPGPLVSLLTADRPAEEFPFELAGVFCIIDTTTFLDREAQWPVLRRQLAFADAVFLTKTDLITPTQLADVEARLSDRVPAVPRFRTDRALPWGLLFHEGPHHTEDEPSAERQQTPVGRRYFQAATVHDAQVLEYSSTRPLDPDRLREVFSTLDSGILRAKGVLYLHEPSGQRYKYVVQYTGAQRQLYSRVWGKQESRQTQLVFLGTAFDAPRLQEALDCCQL